MVATLFPNADKFKILLPSASILCQNLLKNLNTLWDQRALVLVQIDREKMVLGES